jgi:hypothetical protein
MEKIVFVIGDRTNPSARHMKKSGTVTVGRSYSCDIILSDPHIESVQLIFRFDEGARAIEVPVSANPVFCNDVVIRPGLYPFVSGDEWMLGKTRIHVFNEQHDIEPPEKILVREFSGGIALQFAAIVAGTATLAGWIGFQTWLGSYEPVEFGKNIAEALISSGHVWFIVLWSCIMALVCRFKSGRSHFGVLLLAGALYTILNTGFDALYSYASYGFNLGSYWEIFYYAGSVFLLAAFMQGCFAFIMNVQGMRYMALVLSVCWFGFSFLVDVSQKEFLQPDFNQAVKPPFARFVSPQSVDNFIIDNKSVFEESAGHE